MRRAPAAAPHGGAGVPPAHVEGPSRRLHPAARDRGPRGRRARAPRRCRRGAGGRRRVHGDRARSRSRSRRSDPGARSDRHRPSRPRRSPSPARTRRRSGWTSTCEGDLLDGDRRAAGPRHLQPALRARGGARLAAAWRSGPNPALGGLRRPDDRRTSLRAGVRASATRWDGSVVEIEESTGDEIEAARDGGRLRPSVECAGPRGARPRGGGAAAVTGVTPIAEAVAAARRGALIVFPTDTVYGIGTRPDDRRRDRPPLRGQGPAARAEPARARRDGGEARDVRQVRRTSRTARGGLLAGRPHARPAAVAAHGRVGSRGRRRLDRAPRPRASARPRGPRRDRSARHDQREPLGRAAGDDLRRAGGARSATRSRSTCARTSRSTARVDRRVAPRSRARDPARRGARSGHPRRLSAG